MFLITWLNLIDMKINKIFVALLVFLGLVIVTTQIAYAHVLKYDGTIGAVLHVNPDDDPIVGQSTNFFFEFKDKEGKFKPEYCDCKVTIAAEGKEVYSGDLFETVSNPDLTNASFSFVFPSKNIYKIAIHGIAIDDSFQEFTLVYDVRVARVSENAGPEQVGESESDNNFVYIATFILTGLLLIVYKFKNRKKVINS